MNDKDHYFMAELGDLQKVEGGLSDWEVNFIDDLSRRIAETPTSWLTDRQIQEIEARKRDLRTRVSSGTDLTRWRFKAG